ncbi:MAG: SAM-dependent methyltransferase [Firmicutes bacterium]|nr:SAM-dependent methyltransferase [Bacillota bacterium]
MKLSIRLATIADMISNGETVADIGTDHGQLPVFLCEERRCPKVIMTDVSEGSLAKARMTGYQYLQAAERQAADQPLLEARLGDGLAPLAEGEADVVIMAGIGGGLMERILRADPAKSASMGRYILQPRRNPGELRRFLAAAGYGIADETLIPESRYIWEIITAVPAAQQGEEERFLINTAPDSDIAQMVEGADDTLFWEIPSYYAALDDPLMDDYLARKLAREKRNLAGKRRADTVDEEDVAVSFRNIQYIESLIRAREERQ